MNKQDLFKTKQADPEEVDVPIDIVTLLKRKSRQPLAPFVPRYTVTDINWCQRKQQYRLEDVEAEELAGDSTVESMWSLVRGDFLHNLTYAYRWRELDTEYPVKLDDGTTAILAGRLDMYDWKTKTIMDLKTTRFVRWQISKGFLPKQEHLLQVQCYDTMFGQTIPVENLMIVYADMSDIVAFKVPRRDMSKWIQNRVQEVATAIEENTTIAGEPSTMCQYCRYQTRCADAGNGLTEKPLSVPKHGGDNTE